MTRFVPKAITSLLAVAAALGAVDAAAQTKYSAEVRRTSFGIAHIKANDFGSVGYGVGYAFAQDNFCMMADEFVTVRGERREYFGPTGATLYGVNNVCQRLLLHLLQRRRRRPSTAGLAKMKPEVQAAFKGWAAGYNRYLKDTGVANLPAPCKGAAFVRPVDEVDMMRLVRALRAAGLQRQLHRRVREHVPARGRRRRRRTGTANLRRAVLARVPASAGRRWAAMPWRSAPTRPTTAAACSWATRTSRGSGTLRFFQFHVTVPGQMDVMGGSLSGFPFINIGFNKDVAWSHTVDKANHFSLYELKLDPTNPRKYIVRRAVRAT